MVADSKLENVNKEDKASTNDVVKEEDLVRFIFCNSFSQKMINNCGKS